MIEYKGMLGNVVFMIGDSEDSECFDSGFTQEVEACAKLYKKRKASIEDWEGDDYFVIYFIEDDVDASPETVQDEKILPDSVRKELKEIRGE